MKKIIYLLILIIAIISACDRFDHEYKAVITQTADEFVVNFSQQANIKLKNNDINALMDYYSDSYLNDGLNKDDMRAFFMSQNWTDSTMLFIEKVFNNKPFAYNFNLTDSTIHYNKNWVDYLQKINDKWFWVGNKENETEIPQKVVIAQAFTQLTCQSCPNSEAVLNDILQDNPNNFIVLKYHVNDSLATYSQPTIEFSYYGLQTMPTVIFDGRNKIVGASDTALNSYQAIADNMLAEEPELFLEIEFYEVLGQTVSGSVNISFDNNLDLDNLYLYYLVYEEETEALNHANQKATKVVRERKRMILENLENNSVHNFSLESSYFHDTDLYLVVWVQRIVNTSSQNTETDKIYNAVKQRLY